MDNKDFRCKDDLLYRDDVFKVIGAAITVHRELGSGFLESVYQEAMEVELSGRHIPYKTQVRLPVYYKGQLLSKEFIADLIVYDKILLELKCISKLAPVHKAQVINYLKATGLQLGLLINFGSQPKLEWDRVVKSESVFLNKTGLERF